MKFVDHYTRTRQLSRILEIRMRVNSGGISQTIPEELFKPRRGLSSLRPVGPCVVPPEEDARIIRSGSSEKDSSGVPGVRSTRA
ncbi:hypothetical protein ABZ851_32660, partial [Streptomyces sp. NPDC047049]|uniref:hypothetical protein n=1 Tax=Streptomyces sp. NPDC047049 TaxID=3156688 RepID=UPI0033C2FD6C